MILLCNLISKLTVRLVTQVILSAPFPNLGNFYQVLLPQIWGMGGLTEQYWVQNDPPLSPTKGT
jgi:hypothetical protein